eukprot:jgi/Psemu1/19870/gm1.19870_g
MTPLIEVLAGPRFVYEDPLVKRKETYRYPFNPIQSLWIRRVMYHIADKKIQITLFAHLSVQNYNQDTPVLHQCQSQRLRPRWDHNNTPEADTESLLEVETKGVLLSGGDKSTLEGY